MPSKNLLVSTATLSGPNEVIQVAEEKGEATTSFISPSIWFTPQELPERLNTLATSSYLYDTLIDILSVFPEVSKFFAKKIPTMVNGGLAFFPIVVTFLPNIFSCVLSKPTMDPSSDDLVQLEKKVSDTLDEMMVLIDQTNNPIKRQLTAKLDELACIKETLIAEKRANKESEKYALYDNVINAIYLLTRAASGVLMINRATNAESEETSKKMDEADKWINLVSNLAYLGYMLSHYYMNHKRKKAEVKQSIIDHQAESNIASQRSNNTSHFFFKKANTEASTPSLVESNTLSTSLLSRSYSF